MNEKMSPIACLLAIAATSGAAEPPRQTFECDTPAGHFSYWTRSVSASKIDITGKVTVNELRKDGKWIPTTLMTVQSADKANFGVRLSMLPKVKDMYFVEIVKPGGNEKLGLGFIPASSDPIPFAVHIDGSGQLKVSLAGLDGSASTGDFKPANVQLSCSTGDFEFKDVIIED